MLTASCRKSTGSELHAVADREAIKRELGICFAAHADPYGGTVVDAQDSQDDHVWRSAILGQSSQCLYPWPWLVFDPDILSCDYTRCSEPSADSGSDDNHVMAMLSDHGRRTCSSGCCILRDCEDCTCGCGCESEEDIRRCPCRARATFGRHPKVFVPCSCSCSCSCRFWWVLYCTVLNTICRPHVANFSSTAQLF